MLKKIKTLIIFLKNSFLYKMIIFYSLIVIFMFAILTIVISNNYSEHLKQNEIDYENQIITRVADFSDANLDAAKKIIQQIYESDNSRTTFFNYLNEIDPEIIFKNNTQWYRFANMFESAVSGSSNILDIIIIKNKFNSVLHYPSLRKIDLNYDFNSYAWFRKVGESRGVLRVVPSYVPKYIKNDNRPVFSAYAGFLDSSGKLSGVMIINFDAHGMEKSYDKFKDRIKGNILVMDKAGSVFFDSSNSFYGSKYPYFNLLKNSDSYINLDKKSIVVLKDTNNSLIVAGIVSKNQILESINLAKRAMYLIMFLCIFISMILIYIISTYFSKRVNLIAKAMKGVEKGNLKKRIPLGKGNDEVEQISRNFNTMCEKLESYINKVYLAEINTKDAQLTALQTQINPHFLYNTLEMIRMKAIVNNNEDLSEMIYILANLFRNSVKNTDMIIRVEDETNYCMSYLELHKIRLGDRLKVAFEIDKSIRDYAILKLILQPLIENSLVYSGINDNMNSITITISGYKENDVIYISVMDNGMGIEAKELERLKKELETIKGIESESSIGLRNINDRIKIFFGDAYGLEISSVQNSFTKATVRLPAQSVEEARKHVQNTNC